MSARFPREIREQAVDKFLKGMPYKRIGDWLEESYGQRPSRSTVGLWAGKDVTVALLARSRVCMPRKQSLMRLHVV